MVSLTQRIGPLPLWAYGAIAGGGLILLMAKRGHPAAQQLVNPDAAVPAPPGTDGGTQYPPQVIGSGQTYAQPGQSGPTLLDMLGVTSINDFLTKLGPNYSQVHLASGSTGVDVTNVAENALREQQFEYAGSAGLQERGQELAAAIQIQQNQATAGLEAWRQYYTYLLSMYGGHAPGSVSGGGIQYHG